ncbi:MAG: GAF domain-containing protein [Vulcanimicrobiota bacterium]
MRQNGCRQVKSGEELELIKMEDVLFEAVAGITSLLPQVDSAVLFGDRQTRLVLSDKAEAFEGKRLDTRWLESLREPVVLDEPVVESEPSALLLPLVHRDIPLAVLYLGASTPQAFSAAHRVVASLLTPTLVLILSEQWAQYSDALTGLYSHSLFQQKLSDELEWCPHPSARELFRPLRD